MRPFFLALITFVVLVLSNVAEALNVKFPGVNYIPRKGPDWDPDSTKCKSASEMQKDLYALKAVTDKVRIYSLIDCNQAEIILPAAKKAGLQVDLGIWTTFNHSTLEKEKTKLAGLINSGLYDDNVVGFDVAIYMYEIFEADTAVSYMKEIRDYIRSRGKNTPISLADTSDVYTDNPQLVDAADYVSVSYSSFNYGDDVSESVANTLSDLKDVRVLAAKKGKKFVLSETGWSSGGSHPKLSVASPATQAKYFSDLFHVARSHNFDFYWYFAFDTDFRSEIQNDFGVFYVNGTLKSNFQHLTIRQMDPRAIRNVGSKRLLSENGGNVSTSIKSSDWLVQEQQVWFFDSATQQVRSKSSDRCLDAYQGWDGGIVHVYRCMDNEANQKWTFESATGKLKHVKHRGFCLDTDPAQNNKVQLYGCSPNNPNQQWNVINPVNV
ncbi:glucan endo-1 [Phytophthora cinnamomi]|uniref:glucan endo-1 n=1 Tax=Phytophthora cinnamomi TaxID=4785 RepID=UPI0035599C73|nr:glucan endo-1 [Phytophthora cinnamomi]